MSKIVTAVNVMISHQDRITKVLKGAHPTELFFLYDDTHKWSIYPRSEEYYLCYYPNKIGLEELSEISDDEWTLNIPENIQYTSKELGTTEAYQSLHELYTTLNEKVLGMDSILEEIISGDIPF